MATTLEVLRSSADRREYLMTVPAADATGSKDISCTDMDEVLVHSKADGGGAPTLDVLQVATNSSTEPFVTAVNGPRAAANEDRVRVQGRAHKSRVAIASNTTDCKVYITVSRGCA